MVTLSGIVLPGDKPLTLRLSETACSLPSTLTKSIRATSAGRGCTARAVAVAEKKPEAMLRPQGPRRRSRSPPRGASKVSSFG